MIRLSWELQARRARSAQQRILSQREVLQAQRARLQSLQGEYLAQRRTAAGQPAMHLQTLADLITQIGSALATIESQLSDTEPALAEARALVEHWDRKLLGIERREDRLEADARQLARRRENRNSSATLKVPPSN